MSAVTEHDPAAPGSGEGPVVGPRSVRADFGAHLEEHYARLVAQVYAVTLDSVEAHDVVQDAYSQAWREWDEVGSSADAEGWVRRVAVSATIRSWRRAAAEIGLINPGRGLGGTADPRTRYMIDTLARLAAAERRALVLNYGVGMSVAAIATFEGISRNAVHARLVRAWNSVTEDFAGVPEPDLPQRVADELWSLEDELAAAVTLPEVDTVIGRNASFNRVSAAAAAAVLAIGTLGAVTLTSGIAAGPVRASSTDPVLITPPAVVAPATVPPTTTLEPTTTRARPRTTARAPAPVVRTTAPAPTTTRPAPPTTDDDPPPTTTTGNDEGTPDPPPSPPSPPVDPPGGGGVAAPGGSGILDLPVL